MNYSHYSHVVTSPRLFITSCLASLAGVISELLVEMLQHKCEAEVLACVITDTVKICD